MNLIKTYYLFSMQALDGFLFMVSCTGEVEFVSENVTNYLRYLQVWIRFVTLVMTLPYIITILWCMLSRPSWVVSPRWIIYGNIGHLVRTLYTTCGIQLPSLFSLHFTVAHFILLYNLKSVWKALQWIIFYLKPLTLCHTWQLYIKSQSFYKWCASKVLLYSLFFSPYYLSPI